MENERWDPNAALICPYDPLHVISVKRFQRHLIKCRQNHPELDFVACPFNSTHLFHRSDLRRHIAQCPDRRTLDEDVKQNECPETGEVLRLKGNTSMPNVRYVIPDADEDWEGEIEENIAEKYEQQKKYLQNSVPILRRPEQFTFDETSSISSQRSKMNTDINSGYDSDTNSEYSISSRASSLYVEPIKISAVKPLGNNKIKTPTAAVGRGAIALQRAKMSDGYKPVVGRGAALEILKQNLRKPTGVTMETSKPPSIGRGSVRQAAMMFN